MAVDRLPLLWSQGQLGRVLRPHGMVARGNPRDAGPTCGEGGSLAAGPSCTWQAPDDAPVQPAEDPAPRTVQSRGSSPLLAASPTGPS